MNTFTGSYLTRFSSGTIAALLILSSFLFLVPFAPSVHAANASPPSVSATPNVVAAGSTTTFTVDVTNPSSNSYAVTAVVFTFPSGWSVSSASGGNFLTSCTNSPTSVSCSGSPGLPPGATDSVTIDATAPSPSTTPQTYTVTTQVQDASSSAFYTGSSFKLYVVASGTTVTLSLSPTSTTYVAGSAPYTVTASLSPAQAGVPVTWKVTGTGASASPSSGTTGSGGTTSTTFQPSNDATVTSTIKACLGSSTSLCSTVTSITTVAGPAAKVTFTFASTQPTHYLSTLATDSATNAGAKMLTTELSYKLSDAFSNPISFSSVSSLGITLTALSGQGRFDLGGGTTKAVIACGASGTDFTCPTGMSANLPVVYFQGTPFNTIGKISATVVGTSLSVSGSSGNIVTGTFATGSPTPTVSGTPSAGSQVTVTATISPAQSGVPVTLYVCTTGACTTTAGYSGTFTNGLQKITLNTDSTGTVSAKFAVDTKAGNSVQFVSAVAKPTDTNPSAMLANSTASSSVVTAPGSPATFVVSLCFSAAAAPPCSASNTVSKGAVNGTTVFVDVSISDAYGNPTSNPGPNQIQITLSASAGTLSATNVYISAGGSDTFSGFGWIAWTMPSAVGVTATLTASGVLGGVQKSTSKSVSTVSPLPTLSVTSPKPLDGVIYSSSSTVVFNGQANASVGYPPTVTIDSVGYKVGSGSWLSAVIAPGNKIVWSVAATFSAGLNTITFNATDHKGNTVVSPAFKVLVDTSPPTIKFTTADGSTVSSGQAVQAVIVDTLGDLNFTSVSATYNGTAVPSSGIKVTGTNNLGVNTTYTVSISGLPSGKWVVQLSASDLAGNAATPVSITVVVVVPTNQSFTVVGTPSQTTVGGFPAVQVTYQNNLPAAQQGIVFAVVHNTKGQTVLISTATITPGAGAQATAFLVLAGLAPGTYSVDLLVLTSASVTISQTTTVTVTV